MSERLTFDSEAILAFYLREDGGEIVKEFLKKVEKGNAEGLMNIVNLTEIYYILYRKKPVLAEEKCNAIRIIGVKIVPLEDNGIWRRAAQIKSEYPLSLADAFAVATAEASKSTLVIGGDKEFTGLNCKFLKIRG
jgi:predicted nucleic acid-binding protein